MCDDPIFLLEPPAAITATGGYRFNDTLIRAMPEIRRLRRTPAGVARLAGRRGRGGPAGHTNDNPPSPPGVLVVDSLYLRHPAAMGSLRRLRRSGTKCVLLAHLLPSQEQPSANARARGGRLYSLRRYLRARHRPARHHPRYPGNLRGRSGQVGGLHRESAALGAFDGAVAPSHFMKSALAERGVPEERIVVSQPPHGERGQPVPKRSAQNHRLVSVANLHPIKNLHAVIPALPRPHSSGFAWTWEIIGSRKTAPRYFHRIRRIAAMYGVSRRLRFRGLKTPEEVEAAIAAATVLLLPSRFESFGMVAQSAARLGTPIIASNVGGVAEAIGVAPPSAANPQQAHAPQPNQSQGNPSAVLLPPTDTPAWRGALERVLATAATPPLYNRASTTNPCRPAAPDTTADFAAVARLLRTLKEEAAS
ncbi:MAG: glycosyltransferase family 4 protein [bacterium]